MTVETICQLKQEIYGVLERAGCTIGLKLDIFEKIELLEQHLQDYIRFVDGLSSHGKPKEVLIKYRIYKELLEVSDKKLDCSFPDPLGEILRKESEEAKK